MFSSDESLQEGTKNWVALAQLNMFIYPPITIAKIGGLREATVDAKKFFVAVMTVRIVYYNCGSNGKETG
jgi:hypothetical protein